MSDLRSGSSLSPPIRSIMAVPQVDSKRFLPDDGILFPLAKNRDELPAALHDLSESAPKIRNHYSTGTRDSFGIDDGEYVESSKESADRPNVNTITGISNANIEILDHQVSTRRIGSPNVRTTKTGKILHRSKKVGASKKLTAYDRFLQQRSKYLAEHRSELTPQQV
ncbi:hypothetical protein BGX34_000868 [Mortierella sp. NVP85]|nr:hypothetical protein BGX34_000868 [Mortierella sp. NVP85]